MKTIYPSLLKRVQKQYQFRKEKTNPNGATYWKITSSQMMEISQKCLRVFAKRQGRRWTVGTCLRWHDNWIIREQGKVWLKERREKNKQMLISLTVTTYKATSLLIHMLKTITFQIISQSAPNQCTCKNTKSSSETPQMSKENTSPM